MGPICGSNIRGGWYWSDGDVMPWGNKKFFVFLLKKSFYDVVVKAGLKGDDRCLITLTRFRRNLTSWRSHICQSRQRCVRFRWLLRGRTGHNAFFGDAVGRTIFERFTNRLLTADCVDVYAGYRHIGIDFHKVCWLGSRLSVRKRSG